MTVITLTTVGYGEVIQITGDPGAEAFTIIGLLFLGMGVMLYFLSSLTAFIIEGELRDIVRRRSMKRELDELGRTTSSLLASARRARMCLREMLDSGRPCVVIEQTNTHPRELERHETRFPYIKGDATNDENLMKPASTERSAWSARWATTETTSS